MLDAPERRCVETKWAYAPASAPSRALAERGVLLVFALELVALFAIWLCACPSAVLVQDGERPRFNMFLILVLVLASLAFTAWLRQSFFVP